MLLKDQIVMAAEGHEEIFNCCDSNVNSHNKQLGLMTG